MLGVQVRVPLPVFDWAVNVTVLEPVPLAGDALSHEHNPETLQATLLPVVMVTVVLPPQAGAFQLVGEMLT